MPPSPDARPTPPGAARLMARLDALARHSDEAGALTRLYLTPAHRRAADAVAGWMREAGLAVREDALGTVIGRREGRAPGAPALLIGSHIDTVRDAGRYDGALGVLAGVEVADRLRLSGERFDHALEVVAFGDEENVRFPSRLLSSRALVGAVADAELDARDADGISVRAALRAHGADPDGLMVAARPPGEIAGYLELHIEQGPVLEAEGLALGVVTGISGRACLRARLTGQAGHAGTVPMALRRDALTAAAEMALLAEAEARADPAVLATVGELRALPGASNVVPGGALFTVDLRSPDDAARAAARERLADGFAAIARRRGVTLELDATYDAPAAPMSGPVMDVLAGSLGRQGLPARRLPSGAGHDAMVFASLVPTGMLFVRCRGGVSHHPAEAIKESDAALALDAMLSTVQSFGALLPG